MFYILFYQAFLQLTLVATKPLKEKSIIAEDGFSKAFAGYFVLNK